MLLDTAKSSDRPSRGMASRPFIVLAAAVCFIANGCSEPRAAPVNVELARVTLIEVLEHWKMGGTIADLRTRDPEIVAQEILWSQGRKLESFELLDEGRPEDANWFCEVELTLAADKDGSPVKKTVTYVVGTDPVLTVFRAIL